MLLMMMNRSRFHSIDENKILTFINTIRVNLVVIINTASSFIVFLWYNIIVV